MWGSIRRMHREYSPLRELVARRGSIIEQPGNRIMASKVSSIPKVLIVPISLTTYTCQCVYIVRQYASVLCSLRNYLIHGILLP